MIKYKKIKIWLLITIMIGINFIVIPTTHALSKIDIVPNKKNLQVDEELQININMVDVDIAAFSLEIYFDQTKLEYVSGPENSSNTNDRILYTWVSDTGENKQYIEAGTYIFKARENQVASIIVTGEFYNSEGNQIEIEDNKVEIVIGPNQDFSQISSDQTQWSNEKDNSNLRSLRINQEGISPDFNPDIKEYYFIASKEIDKLDVTAIPENNNATVTVTGNDNLRFGENTIDIRVESEDGSETSIYKIYVTRTENIEKANANLGNLAVRQATLNPEFDSNMTQYEIEFANDINKLDILAIPQTENAKVNIIGNDMMEVGHNTIEITVTAEDGITNKKYVIDAYRRNKEEDAKYLEQQEIEAERLTAILDKQNNENDNMEQNNNSDISNIEEQNSKKNKIIAWVIVGFLIIVGIGIWLYKKLKDK